MKKKAFCVLKGKQKTEFDILFDRCQGYKRTIERLSIDVFKDQKTLWSIIRNLTPKNKRRIFENPCSFRYDFETGEIFINEDR